MEKYSIGIEDKKIIDELDSLCGVVSNKEVLKNMVLYSQLKKNGIVDFGNYNIIVRNNSDYNLLNDLLDVTGRVLEKNGIISNSKVYYLEKYNKRRENAFDNILGIDEGIIVINTDDFRFDKYDEFSSLEKNIKKINDKIIVFEDNDYCEGSIDAKIGKIASWKMNIEKISIEDKLMYLKNMLIENGIKYKSQELRKFADKPIWKLKNDTQTLIIDCKSKGVTKVNTEILKKIDKNTKISRKVRSSIKEKEDFTDAKLEMEKLIGLNNIKEEVEKILNFVKVNKDRGNMPSLHMCMSGNPGTGKTSVARIIGKLFKEENILEGDGDFVEIHGRDLVDKYVGWTASKVHDIIESALGGVLFIDEAYSLCADRRGSFEDEAIATLIKEMEDHRDEICIILAGYTAEMEELLKRNPGFKSRIQFNIDFPDYSIEELYRIFEMLCKEEKFNLSKNCKETLYANFEIVKNIQDFGNGRYVRNLFEKIKFEQANRLVKSKSKNLNTITEKDIKEAIKSMEMKSSKKEYGFR